MATRLSVFINVPRIRNPTPLPYACALSRRLRPYATTATNQKPPSPHAEWYASIAPALVPIALLGSAVYLALQYAQTSLAHEKYVDEQMLRIGELEREVQELKEQRQTNLTAKE